MLKYVSKMKLTVLSSHIKHLSKSKEVQDTGVEYR